MSAATETPVVFECGGDQLVGVLHRSTRPDARVGVLVVVGGPQYRIGSHRQFVSMARSLAAAGYPVFRFDYRGMGDAEGEPRNFEHVGDDVRAAIDAFRSALPTLDRVVLWGLCDAASAILMVDPLPRDVAGRIVVNPWARTESGEARAYVRHYYLKRVLQRDFWRKLTTGAMDLRKAAGQFIAALRRSGEPGDPSTATYIGRMRTGAMNWKGPTLIVLSGRDLTAREFESLCECEPDWGRFLSSAEVETVKVPGADHTFSDSASLSQAHEVYRQWISSLDPATSRERG